MQVYGESTGVLEPFGVFTAVFKVSSLSDKTNNSTDNNAAKTVALDHLGVIAARLTTSSLKFRNVTNHENIKSLEEVTFRFPLLSINCCNLLFVRFLQKLIKHN